MKTKTNRLLSFVLALAMVFTSFFNMSNVVRADEVNAAVAFASWTAPAAGTEISAPVASATGNGSLAFSGDKAITVSGSGYTVTGPAEGDYWTVSFDASNYSNLTFSAKLRSSGTGPAHIQLQYFDAEGNWQNVGEVQTLNKNLNNVYKEVVLPEALNNTNVTLRLLVADNVSVSGKEIALTGNTNINNISITGNGPAIEVTPVVEKPEKVKASVSAGEVEAGTKVELTCATADAEIYYNLGGDGYLKYSEAITVDKALTIKAYAQKNDVKSEESSFTYTIKKVAGKKLTLDEIISGEEFVLATCDGKYVLSANADKDNKGNAVLVGIKASVSDEKLNVDKDTLSEKTIANLNVKKVEDSEYYVITRTYGETKEYLVSGPTGNSIKFVEEAKLAEAVGDKTEKDYSYWTFTAQEKGFNIVNVNAKFTKNNETNPQAIEFYNAFTTYSFNEKNSVKDAFVLNAYTYPELTEKAKEDAPVEEEKPAETKLEGTLFTRGELYDGDQFVIYYPTEKIAITATANGKKLNGTTEKIEVVDNKADFTGKGAAVITAVSAGSKGQFYLVSDNKYLTSGATGSSLSFADAESEYAIWEIEKSEIGYRFKNVNAKYGTSNQYIEYYTGFTTYSYKSASEANYTYQLFLLKQGSKAYAYNKEYTATIAQFAGNANYDDLKITEVIKGDLYTTNDLLDEGAEYTAVVSGKNSKPYTSAKSTTTGSTSYYMGGTGLGASKGDYMQLKFSTLGYTNMTMSFRLRASNTAAGKYQLQYSTDGNNFENFTKGKYHVAYTQYGSDGTSSDVVKDGEITDGVANAGIAATKYHEYTFEVPAGASNANMLYIRLVADTEMNAKGSAKPSDSGVVRIDSIVVTGNPIEDDTIVGNVSADPESGAVALNSELTLSTKTEGATIYYSVNDSEFAVYDSANKPVLSTLPARVVSYATKEGLTDSIKSRYTYKQAQCETVKATPNGGAVVAGTRVKLKCNTEDSTIKYRFVETDSDGKVTEAGEWITYSESFAPELPCKIEVVAEKEGYITSTSNIVSFTEKANSKYNIYFGQIHAHTNYSDGAGSCDEAFEYATKVKNLDYIAITDHSNSLDNAGDSDITKNVDTKETDEWTAGHELAKKYTTDKFTAVYGYEMTWSNGLGHMNTFNTPGFQSRTQTAYSTYSTALQNYYEALNKVPNSISQFNHPGTTFGDFSDFAYYTEANDDLITMIEVGNGEGTIGSSGYFPSYEYYTRALDKGWHVAPTNNQDNHKGKWGDANTARTVMLADENNEENIYDSMRNYRIYATEDNNLSIYYTLDKYVMGTILDKDSVGKEVELEVELKDADKSDKIGKVEVIVNGGLSIANKTVDTNEETVKFTVPSSYSYYYIKVTEADGDIAVTAPVWVGSVEACGINNTYTNTTLAVSGESLDVNVDFYNNEKSELVIDNIKIERQDAEDNTITVLENGKLENPVAANSTATFKFDYTHTGAGKVTYIVTVNATLNGVEKVYQDKLSVNYVIPEMVTNVIIDGTHYGDYVTGYYGGNVSNFVKLAGENSTRVTVEREAITAEALKDCKLLVLSAPAKKNGTANAGDYKVSHYEPEFLELVKNYVANGGSVIVCGMADYQDTTDGQTATEQNKLLEAIGSTIRVNSDEVYDEENNGGQAYRMYPTNFNMDSKYLAGVVDGQKYSQYSGCSINVDNAVETELVYAAESLVKGFDTTYSIDCRTDAGEESDSSAYVEKGKVTFFAHQATKTGGNIFVAGGVFLSDFEVKAEIDNPDDKPYANYNIAVNILKDIKAQLPTSTIAEARAGEMGDVFAVEGYVTAARENEYNTFFDTIYIQDDTAGIDIFPYATTIAMGTKVRVVGFVSQYQGDKELRVISTEILDAEPKIYEPKLVSTKDAMDYDKLGGSLLKTKGTVTRIEYNPDGTVAEFWMKDSTNVEAAIFIDGYIFSATTGKNELSSFVKVGANVEASGILYMHPEGSSDVSVPVFRVRNCDEIKLVGSASSSSSSGSNVDAGFNHPLSTIHTAVSNVVSNIVNRIRRNRNNTVTEATPVEETVAEETAAEETTEETVEETVEEVVSDDTTPLAGEQKKEFPIAPIAATSVIIVIIGAGLAVAGKKGLFRK